MQGMAYMNPIMVPVILEPFVTLSETKGLVV